MLSNDELQQNNMFLSLQIDEDNMTNLTNSKAPSFIQNLTGINKDEEVEIQNSAPSGNPKAPSFLQ
jgi:hypothetical protein